MKRPGAAAALCLVGGLGDLATGLLLVAVPGLVLRLLEIGVPAGELPFLRFVGAFVGAVGAAYLYPWMFDGAPRERRRRVVLELTAGVRLTVAAFLGTALAAGWLPLPWLTVALYDAALAAVQLLFLTRGYAGDAA